jgi:hypothetical protein
MIMNNPKNNSAVVTVLNNRIAAIQKYLVTEKAEIPVNGVLLKPAGVIKLYQKSLKARADVVAGQAAHKGALTARDAAEADRLAADENLKAWVLGRFGAGSVEASEFGFAPRKAPVVSAAMRAHAVEQNKATREARGTVGRKKKLAIKGVIPTSTVPAAPASPVTTAPANPPAAPATPVTTAPANAVVTLPALLTTAPAAAAPPAASAPVAGASVTTPPPTATPAAVPVLVPAAAPSAGAVTNGAAHS